MVFNRLIDYCDNAPLGLHLVPIKHCHFRQRPTKSEAGKEQTQYAERKHNRERKRPYWPIAWRLPRLVRALTSAELLPLEGHRPISHIHH